MIYDIWILSIKELKTNFIIANKKQHTNHRTWLWSYFFTKCLRSLNNAPTPRRYVFIKSHLSISFASNMSLTATELSILQTGLLVRIKTVIDCCQSFDNAKLNLNQSLARLFKLFSRFSISADIFSRPYPWYNPLCLRIRTEKPVGRNQKIVSKTNEPIWVKMTHQEIKYHYSEDS